MDSNTSIVIVSTLFFGWIPILSLCKGISWIVEANKDEKEVDIPKEISEVKEQLESIQNFTNGISNRISNNDSSIWDAIDEINIKINNK